MLLNGSGTRLAVASYPRAPPACRSPSDIFLPRLQSPLACPQSARLSSTSSVAFCDVAIGGLDHELHGWRISQPCCSSLDASRIPASPSINGVQARCLSESSQMSLGSFWGRLLGRIGGILAVQWPLGAHR
eukprot:4179323-Pyramimonas_sp.AAC.1